MNVTINCDMGEGFALYRIGNDAAIMQHVDLANVACGFHASDPSIMRQTVRLAKQHGVKVGAHPPANFWLVSILSPLLKTKTFGFPLRIVVLTC